MSLPALVRGWCFEYELLIRDLVMYDSTNFSHNLALASYLLLFAKLLWLKHNCGVSFILSLALAVSSPCIPLGKVALPCTVFCKPCWTRKAFIFLISRIKSIFSSEFFLHQPLQNPKSAQSTTETNMLVLANFQLLTPPKQLQGT